MITRESITKRCEDIKRKAALVARELSGEDAEKLATAVLTMDFFCNSTRFDKIALKRVQDECVLITQIVERGSY